MSTYTVSTDELAKIVAGGYKDLLEATLQKAIKEHTDIIIEDAVKNLASLLDAGINCYKNVEKNNVVVELYIDKTKLNWKEG